MPNELNFELLQSNDGHYAKRARVAGGFIYLFTDWDDVAGHSRATASCFVPDVPKGATLNAEDIYAMTHRR